jgi:hypothetical protein
MELRKHIQLSSTMMLTQLKIINIMELYGEEEYDFFYGMNEKHTSFVRMFKEIKRVLCRKK